MLGSERGERHVEGTGNAGWKRGGGGSGKMGWARKEENVSNARTAARPAREVIPLFAAH